MPRLRGRPRLKGQRCNETPAIVVANGRTGLGMLRALHMAGIPTWVACPANDLASHSRWFRPLPGHDPWNGNCGLSAADLLATLPAAVLIPGADDAALWMADLPLSPWGQRFPVSTSSRDTLEILQDKSRFAEFLRGTDIPHPRTFPIRCREDIAAIPFGEIGRVFVKPANSQEFSRLLGVKALAADGRADVERIWEHLRGKGLHAMVQEYVPGAASDHYFVDGFRDAHGTLTGLFARRRWRIHPPDFGNSSYCESIALDEVRGALTSLEELLSALAYRGIFSAEFKRDARDGAFRILEVNTRAWWYVEFAARCGINVCEMAYRDAQGLAVAPSARNYPVGVGCVNLPADIKAVLKQSRGTGSWWKILRQWLGSHFLVFRADDPAPAWATLWGMLRYRLGTLRKTGRV